MPQFLDHLANDALPRLYRKLQELGAGREILAAVRSWGDTLDDEEVLALLEDWNAVERSARN